MKVKIKYEPRFFLNEVKGETERIIMLNVWCDDESRMKYSTGKRIRPTHWNKSGYNVTTTNAKVDFKGINNRIDELKKRVHAFVNERQAANKPVLSMDMKDYLLIKDDRKPLQEAPTVRVKKLAFYEALDEAVRLEARDGVTHNNKPYAAGTVKNWKIAKVALEAWKKDLTYEMILSAEVSTGGKKAKNKLYNDFVKFMFDEGNKASYIDRIIKDSKKIMRLAEMPLPDSWRRLSLLDDEDEDKIYLDREQIAKLYYYDNLTETEKIIRDMFVVNCETAFRISDMRTLSMEDVRDDYITKKTKKSGFIKTQSVPLSGTVREILERYNGQFPHCYHENVVNKKIKEIAGQAGIERAGEISNHTARRSFITNMIDAGYKIRQVANMLGVSVAVIEKAYYKNNSVKTVNEVKKDDYFNIPLKKTA